MKEFAKLFQSKKYGQIVAILQERDGECIPEIRLWFNPPDLGVCQFALGFKDSDEGRDRSEQMFKHKIDLEMVENIVGGIYKDLGISNEPLQVESEALIAAIEAEKDVARYKNKIAELGRESERLRSVIEEKNKYVDGIQRGQRIILGELYDGAN